MSLDPCPTPRPPGSPVVDQILLDELYWNTDRTAKSIATELGLPSHQLSRLATPLDAGVGCWWCRTPLRITSRAQVKEKHVLACHDCGAETRRFEAPHALADTDAVIMVATTGRRSPKDLSADIADGVRALADVGLRWSGRYLAVDVRLGPIGVRDAVLAENVTTVVVSSIRALGLGQGDAMCTFRCLARVGLRVITANDWSWTNNRPLFGMEGAWQDRCGYGSSYEARPGYNGPTWEDEYEMFGGEDFGSDDEGGPDFVLRFVPDHRW